jgi:hypothetical protein
VAALSQGKRRALVLSVVAGCDCLQLSHLLGPHPGPNLLDAVQGEQVAKGNARPFCTSAQFIDIVREGSLGSWEQLLFSSLRDHFTIHAKDIEYCVVCVDLTLDVLVVSLSVFPAGFSI